MVGEGEQVATGRVTIKSGILENPVAAAMAEEETKTPSQNPS